jgi:NAD(P)-dependent dehydrogenase (short-subunit alcohol dehydrogenase family)
MAECAIIVGAGPGLGAALGRRFAREGFSVALLARNPDTLSPVERSVKAAAPSARVLALPCDASDTASVAEAFRKATASLGPAGVLVYNAGAFRRAPVIELDASQVERDWRVACLGALLCAQQVLPGMVQRKAGTILLTGATASLRGGAKFASFAIGKFGLRALSQSMARELGPQGIHVAHIVIDGQIGPEEAGAAPPTRLAPDALAEAYWQLHRQHPSTWTLELDLRPAAEKF